MCEIQFKYYHRLSIHDTNIRSTPGSVYDAERSRSFDSDCHLSDAAKLFKNTEKEKNTIEQLYDQHIIGKHRMNSEGSLKTDSSMKDYSSQKRSNKRSQIRDSRNSVKEQAASVPQKSARDAAQPTK